MNALRCSLPLLATLAIAPPAGAVPDAQNSWNNDIPPRLQWNNNFGYCGEVSLTSAGLYYGQYASQYDVRATASPGVAQNRSSSQLLLGVNDQSAAAAMHLAATEWNTASTHDSTQFLAWVKQNVVKGYPVAIGVYTNEYRFYGKTNSNAGDAQYDHIVPVTGIASNYPLSNTGYYSTDVISFSDNGLWSPGGTPTYAFSYSFSSFQKTRAQANAHAGPIYSLAKSAGNYGLAVTGISDPDHETLPVRVDTSLNYELPEIVNGSNVRPAPMPLVLTVTVSGLHPGVSYKLYRYDSFTAVPDTAFNANEAKASESWNIKITAGSSYVLTESIESNDIVVYRAVPASGS